MKACIATNKRPTDFTAFIEEIKKKWQKKMK